MYMKNLKKLQLASNIHSITNIFNNALLPFCIDLCSVDIGTSHMLEEVGAFSVDFPHNWCQPCIGHQREKASSSLWQLILGAVERNQCVSWKC